MFYVIPKPPNKISTGTILDFFIILLWFFCKNQSFGDDAFNIINISIRKLDDHNSERWYKKVVDGKKWRTKRYERFAIHVHISRISAKNNDWFFFIVRVFSKESFPRLVPLIVRRIFATQCEIVNHFNSGPSLFWVKIKSKLQTSSSVSCK